MFCYELGSILSRDWVISGGMIAVNGRGAKMRRRVHRNVCRLGMGVVSGGVLFVGQAQAGNLVNESFESSPSALFGAFESYAYSQGYTGNTIPPAAGDRYYTAGAVPSISKVAAVSLVDSSGLPSSVIDAGLGRYNFSTWFSSYAQDPRDWSQVTLQFQDGANNNVGQPVVLGGLAFINALSTDPSNGFLNWAQDTRAGSIPAQARNAVLTLFSQRAAGNSLDGYVDLIQLDVSQAVVPEPGGAAALLTLGALGSFVIRRRRGGTA